MQVAWVQSLRSLIVNGCQAFVGRILAGMPGRLEYKCGMDVVGAELLRSNSICFNSRALSSVSCFFQAGEHA